MNVKYQKVFSSPISTAAIPAFLAAPGPRWAEAMVGHTSYRRSCHIMPQMINASGQIHYGLLGAKMPLLAQRLPNS